MEVYIVFSEEFERSVATFSTLEKAKKYLKKKEKKYGRHTLIKTNIDGLPVKLNDYFEYISIEDL